MSGHYRVRFRFGGQEFKRSLKTTERKEAEGALGRIEETVRLLERGRLEIPSGVDPAQFILSDGKLTRKPVLHKTLTLEGLFTIYEEKLTEGSKEANTRRVERIHAKHVKGLLGAHAPLSSLSSRDLQDYVDQRARQTWKGKSLKPQTIKKELDTLRAIWSWAARYGYVPSPFPRCDLTYPKQKERPPFQTWSDIERTVNRGGISVDAAAELWDCLFLNVAEIGEVLAFVRANTQTDWLYPLFVFAAHTGARKSEMLRSQVDDFNFGDQTVLIREKKRSKSKETYRRVDLTPLLQSVMKAYLAQKHPGGHYTICRNANAPLRESTAHDAFLWVLHRSKWKVLRGYHVFRHSFASNLAAAGVDQRIIDEWMGHQTEAMRRRYRHLFPDQRRKALELVFPGERE